MKNYVLGIIIILLGVIIGLNSFEIISINLFFSGWWTLFIIIPSLISLFSNSSKTGSLVALIIGILLLLSCQNIISFDTIYKLILPIILVAIGVSFIFKDNKPLKEDISNNDEICATFKEEVINVKDTFKGVNLTSVFGSIKYDLSSSTIKEDVTINASSIFGGIDIITKEDVNVKVKSTSIFGGVNNKCKSDGKYTIYVNATCLFGGVNIK